MYFMQFALIYLILLSIIIYYVGTNGYNKIAILITKTTIWLLTHNILYIVHLYKT